ncbi:CPBP family intramembrane metalloprotease [Solirubrobacter phytolaccae]|uniref:CPBP family intramembrane metalloprotease n=1 Tax=Solirubrobacter phytolaccae TaxID=1404360 RepID=A0A9X3S7H6_9ACTN|nr:CPBP family intramembrane glutamic endopeptidase [Solirubrobacter phytolaccae]MDA0181054.1 CPBP family intramembrane metalloprotease [Solirubrobacter phytolaccae]
MTTPEPPTYGGWQPPEAPHDEAPVGPPAERQVPAWAPFAALAAALMIVLLIGGTLLGLLQAADPDFDSDDIPVGVTLGLTVFQSVVFVIAACITVRLALGRVPREAFGLNRVSRVWQAIGLVVLVYVGFIVFQNVLVEIFGKPEEQALVEDVKNEDSALVLVGYVLTICLIAPVVEEFFFRGFMFGALARRLGPWWGMAITGVVFGLAHAPNPAISLIALGAFGVGLCLLYWRTQSIVPCMALHALNNSITFGLTRELDPALFAGIVIGSVGAVTVAAQALSSRRSVAA